VTGPRRFDLEELGGDAPGERDDAATAAAWLDAAMLDVPAHPTADFTDRVMTALEHEPTPAPGGFLAPVRRLGFLAGFVASVRQAWASASTGGRPAMVRASALAYVLAVALAGTALAGVATVGVGSALGIIGPSSTQTPMPATPGPTETSEPSGLEPPESTEPPGSTEPGESLGPDATDDHGGGAGPEPSDDHGDNSGPGSSGSGSDDNSGPSSSSGSDDHGGETPGPTSTPRASGTPKPTQTSSSGGDG
jgi:hypothetical protein